MKSSLFLSAALACVTSPAWAQNLPSLPGPNGPAPAAPRASTPPSSTAPALPTAQQLYEHVRRGIVLVQKGGMPLGVGTVLGTDGRILTALSGLAGADAVDVLYADGTAVHAKVGDSDAETDLALLVPQASAGAAPRATEGLAASERDPIGARLRALLPGRGSRVAPSEVAVKGPAETHARDGQPLLQMLDVDLRGPFFAGTPLLDAGGDVVAVLVKECKGPAQGEGGWAAWGSLPQLANRAAACAPTVVAAPVSTIRSFLTRTPLAGPSAAPAAAAAPAPAPWLGIRGEPESGGAVHGVRVVAVAPQSPAEKAGLKPAEDVIAAVDGQSTSTPEQVSEAIAKHAPGDTVKLLVFGQGKFRDVTVSLRAAP